MSCYDVTSGVRCRHTETGEFQCFCQWGFCDTRPMNGTACEGYCVTDSNDSCAFS